MFFFLEIFLLMLIRKFLADAQDTNGWYILRDWNMMDFNFKNVLIKLQTKYGVSPYFKVSVRPNPWSPGENIIAIFPSGLGLPDKSYYYFDENNSIQSAYKQYIKDIVISLNEASINTEKFSTDMFYYEKRIAEITPDSFDLMDFVNSYSLVKLSELKYTIPMLPVEDILATLYPEINISGETEVLVSNLDYLNKVSQIISSTDTATLNSYLMWTLVREYIPYLSSKFISSYNLFNGELLGFKKDIPRWESCSKFVYKFAGLAIENYLDKENENQNKVQVVNNIFNFIRDAVKNHVEMRYKKTPDFYRHLSKKISGLKIQVGLPKKLLNITYLKQYYSKLKVRKTSYFDNYKNGMEFLRKLEGQRLISPEPEDVFVDYALAEPLSASYIPSENTIIVPRILLSKPFFHEKYPSSILYGRLGVEIAKAIVSSVTPFESGWSSNLKLLLPVHFIVNESLRISNEPRSCLTRYLIENNISPKTSAAATSLSVLKELSALKFAHIGLYHSLEKREHIHQPTLENLEDDSLFFLTYSQMHCSALTNQKDLFLQKVEFKLSQKSVLKVATDHYSPILESLECPSSKQKTNCGEIF